MKNKTNILIVTLCVVCAATAMTGCIDLTNDDDYNTIWSATGITCVANRASDGGTQTYTTTMTGTVPYTKHDWKETVDMKELVDTMGIDYNTIDVIAEENTFSGDSFRGYGKCILYIDGGTVTITIHITASRYHVENPQYNIETTSS